MKADSTKAKCSILLQRRKDGNYSVGIAIKNVPVRKSPCGKYFLLVDINEKLPMGMDCDGVHLKPWLVLKIFRKLKARDRQRIDQIVDAKYLKNKAILI